MRQSYDAGMYAFTADFLRLDVLYSHEGIYLDTDIVALKPFDDCSRHKAFAVYLEWAVPTFGLAGSTPRLPIIKELRDNPPCREAVYKRGRKL